jgi:UDP-glucose 4-epimerase
VNGYLGANLAHVLQQRNCRVTGYDVQADTPWRGLPYVPLDVTCEAAWKGFDADVDVVYFFAGLTGTHKSFEQSDKYIAVNVQGLVALCERLRRCGRMPRVVFPSTRLVYRGSERPLREDDPQEARTLYAASKLAGERILEAYQHAFGLAYTICRVCVPYGSLLEMPQSYGTIGAFLKTARSGAPITLFGDGNQCRTVTHMRDLVAQIVGVAEAGAGANEVFNVGGEAFSLKELASLIARRYGVAVTHRDWPAADLRLESGSTVFDDAKIRQVLPAWTRTTFGEWVSTLA